MVKTSSPTGGNDMTTRTVQNKYTDKRHTKQYKCHGNLTPKTAKSTRTSTTKYQGLTPNKTFAEAVIGTPKRCTPPQTGNSSTGTTRSHMLGDVTPRSCDNNDNLSNKADDDGTKSSNNDTNNDINEINQNPTSTNKEPFTKQNNTKRQKWTIEEKRDLYKCYCEAITKGLKTTEGTYLIWRNKNQNKRPNMDAVKLSNQRRIVEKWLTKSEKENMKESLNTNNSQNENNDRN